MMKSSISIILLLFLASVHSAPSPKLSKAEQKVDKDSNALPAADKPSMATDGDKDGKLPTDLPFSGMIPEVEGLVDGMAPGIGSRIHTILNPLLRKSQIHFLSLTEDLLERSTEMVDHVGELVDKMRNQTKFRSETKQKLRYMKKKARHLREDIEDQIEIEKEKAAKAEAEEDKRKAKESIHLLKEAKQKLKAAIKGRLKKNVKRSTWSLDEPQKLQDELPWIIELPPRRLSKRSTLESEDDSDRGNNDNDSDQEEKYAEERSMEVEPKRHQRRNLMAMIINNENDDGERFGDNYE